MSHTPVYLPLGLKLSGLPCLVVGGGPVGTRKVQTLLGAGAVITVVAPQVSDEIGQLAVQGKITWRPCLYDPAQLAERPYVLVVAATSDTEVNDRIGREAEARGLLCCVASGPDPGRVVFPAVHATEEIVVAVHTNGRNVRRSQQVRNQIAKWLAGKDEG